MVTCSVLILFTCFASTRNLALSCVISGGYFTVIAIGSCLLKKTGLPLCLRLMGQVSLTVIILICASSMNRSNIAENTKHSATNEAATKKEANPVSKNEKVVNAPPSQESGSAPRVSNKEEKLRDFALREAPEVWRTYEDIGVAIEQLDVRLSKLRENLELFDKPADEDQDFTALSTKRDDMSKSHNLLREKLEQAYIQSRKFAAAPQRKEFDELRRKALEDGIREADSARTKFENLRSVK